MCVYEFFFVDIEIKDVLDWVPLSRVLGMMGGFHNNTHSTFYIISYWRGMWVPAIFTQKKQKQVQCKERRGERGDVT